MQEYRRHPYYTPVREHVVDDSRDKQERVDAEREARYVGFMRFRSKGRVLKTREAA